MSKNFLLYSRKKIIFPGAQFRSQSKVFKPTGRFSMRSNNFDKFFEHYRGYVQIGMSLQFNVSRMLRMLLKVKIVYIPLGYQGNCFSQHNVRLDKQLFCGLHINFYFLPSRPDFVVQFLCTEARGNMWGLPFVRCTEYHLSFTFTVVDSGRMKTYIGNVTDSGLSLRYHLQMGMNRQVFAFLIHVVKLFQIMFAIVWSKDLYKIHDGPGPQFTQVNEHHITSTFQAWLVMFSELPLNVTMVGPSQIRYTAKHVNGMLQMAVKSATSFLLANNTMKIETNSTSDTIDQTQSLLVIRATSAKSEFLKVTFKYMSFLGYKTYRCMFGGFEIITCQNETIISVCDNRFGSTDSVSDKDIFTNQRSTHLIVFWYKGLGSMHVEFILENTACQSVHLDLCSLSHHCHRRESFVLTPLCENFIYTISKPFLTLQLSAKSAKFIYSKKEVEYTLHKYGCYVIQMWQKETVCADLSIDYDLGFMCLDFSLRNMEPTVAIPTIKYHIKAQIGENEQIQVWRLKADKMHVHPKKGILSFENAVSFEIQAVSSPPVSTGDFVTFHGFLLHYSAAWINIAMLIKRSKIDHCVGRIGSQVLFRYFNVFGTSLCNSHIKMFFELKQSRRKMSNLRNKWKQLKISFNDTTNSFHSKHKFEFRANIDKIYEFAFRFSHAQMQIHKPLFAYRGPFSLVLHHQGLGFQKPIDVLVAKSSCGANFTNFIRFNNLTCSRTSPRNLSLTSHKDILLLQSLVLSTTQFSRSYCSNGRQSRNLPRYSMFLCTVAPEEKLRFSWISACRLCANFGGTLPIFYDEQFLQSFMSLLKLPSMVPEEVEALYVGLLDDTRSKVRL